MDLNLENLHQLLSIPKPETEALVAQKVLDVIRVCEDRFEQTLIVPSIAYDVKGRTAGWCTGPTSIRLNVDILNDPRYTDDMISQTVPHEVAHCVTRQVWPGAHGHGGDWQYVMAILGLPATRCHNYEVTPARKRKPADRPWKYVCSCRIHMVTNILHKRIQSGTQYTCNACGGDITREI